MKFLAQATFILIASVPAQALAGPEQDADFAARCSGQNVVICVGFDELADVTMPHSDYVKDPAPHGLMPGPYVPPRLDSTNSASGISSLLFTIPSNSGADTSGAYWTNFSDDFSVQFGEGSPHGKEFYIQWRQKLSPELLDTFDGGAGWKQIIIGEGDRPGKNLYSCTAPDIVVQNINHRGFPQMYHSCGAKDGNYEGLETEYRPDGGGLDFKFQNAMPEPYCLYSKQNDPESNNCFFYKANQWMTFQVRVIIGTAYKNDKNYKYDSTIQLWVAEEGKPSQLVIDRSPENGTGYDLYNNDPLVRHLGQVWFTPYNTGKKSGQAHPEGYTWYDELIVSKSRIPDPMVPGDSVPPAPPSDISAQ